MKLKKAAKKTKIFLKEGVEVFYWKERDTWKYKCLSIPLTKEFILDISRKADNGVFTSLTYDTCPEYTTGVVRVVIRDCYEYYSDKLENDENIGIEILNDYLEKVV